MWNNENGLTYLQIVVPKVLRTEILNELHDAKSDGHLGLEKTLGKVLLARDDKRCILLVSDLRFGSA